MAWLKPELSKEQKEEKMRQEQVQMATEKLRRAHLRRAGNSRRNYSTQWRGLRYSILLDLLFLIAGVNGKHHPVMRTILDLDPQFEKCRETMLAYASEIYDLPKPEQSTNSTVPGRLCLFNRNETFTYMAPCVLDSGGSCCMTNKVKDFVPGSLRPSTKVVRAYHGGLKANLQEGTLDWTAVDDDGKDAPLPMEKSLFVPHAAGRIFAPAHWAKNLKKKNPHARTTSANSSTTHIGILSWTEGNKRRTVTMPVAPHNNIAYLHVKVPHTTFSAFTLEAGLDNDKETVTFPSASGSHRRRSVPQQ